MVSKNKNRCKKGKEWLVKENQHQTVRQIVRIRLTITDQHSEVKKIGTKLAVGD
jgi:hypothetical protein